MLRANELCRTQVLVPVHPRRKVVLANGEALTELLAGFHADR
jgi:hypothetical protein